MTAEGMMSVLWLEHSELMDNTYTYCYKTIKCGQTLVRTEIRYR